MKRLIMDLDNTLTYEGSGPYSDVKPRLDVINKLKEYKKAGFEIVIFTSRNMRTYEASIGKINANTLPVIIDWLKKFDIPFDEIHIGKPWCGHEGFYVDDKAIRPSEFRHLDYNAICQLLENEK